MTPTECLHDTRGRREFLKLIGAGTLGLALPGGFLFAQGARAKPLRGIFPIAQTPFTASGKLDLDGLVEEVKFVDRGGVHGFVWPQMFSEWLALTEQERLQGMEAIASAGKKLRPAIVFGVQAADLATSLKLAKYAAEVGADGIISLPPSENLTAQQMLDYYKAIGTATKLPLVVQAVGNMDIDLIMAMYKTIPAMRCLKEEAGDVLASIVQLTKLTSGNLKVMTGSHGRTLIDEMRIGSWGCMPVGAFADLYAATWDLWHQGKHKEAMDMHARTLLLLTEAGVYSGTEPFKYILYLRGVFKAYAARQASASAPGFAAAAKAAAAGTGPDRPLDEAGKQSIKEVVDYLKPYFRA
jgi:dihydrodipicolinate synthase/N-acetylneuraminate lyase